jgi:hypothetical protein
LRGIEPLLQALLVLGQVEVPAAEEEVDTKRRPKPLKARKREKPRPRKKAETAGETEGENAVQTGIVEQREIEIVYLTHDMAEIGKGLKEDELVIRELHRQYKDKTRSR